MHVHRRGKQQRRGAGQRSGGEQIIGQSQCQLRHDVGGRGGDEQKRAGVGQPDMLHIPLHRRVEEPLRDGGAAQRL